VPEYHDCQRLITSDSQYGPLVAVFAAFNLDTLIARLDSNNAHHLFHPGTTITQAETVGEILNLGPETYAELGIPPGFSCLRLYYKDSTRKAKIQPVGNEDSKCLSAFDPVEDGTGLSELDVKPKPTRELSDMTQYPAVARWDWDAAGLQQYIGIKCEARLWCEVGRSGFTQSNADLDPSTSTTPEAKVRRIKGWYDEQQLDIPGTEPGKFVPSTVLATIIPHPDLVTFTKGKYDNETWVLTGYVALDKDNLYYKNKFGFDAVLPGSHLSIMNTIEFCLGTRVRCGIPSQSALPPNTCGMDNWKWSASYPRWWARIQSASKLGTNEYKYRCVVRRSHPEQGATVPGTARWRWLANDPTVWEECLQGCCEIESRIS
jgi:hypothetical protein